MDARYQRAAWTLIVAAALWRLLYLAYLCPFDLAEDEAHYWDWSRQLDWCYYSKGPLIAWLIRASCAIFGDNMLAVRLPAVLCGSLLLLGLYTLTVQIHQDTRLGFAVVALTLTFPLVSAGALLMTIDAPFTCAWMWALVFAHRAISLAGRASDGGDRPSLARPANAWLCAGLCILLGILAKHTMVLFVPSLAMFMATTSSVRMHLKRPGFWIMTGLGALGGVPLLVWNAWHGWPTLWHTQGHAGFDQAAWTWLGPLRFLGGQAAILLGVWFLLWVWAMWVHRPSVEARADQRFLWWMSAPTFIFFALFAFKNGGGEANWPIAAYLSGGVLVAGMLAAGSRRQAARVAMLGFAAMGMLISVALHMPMQIQPVLLRIAGPATTERPMPLRRVDPTARLRGWRYLASEIDKRRAELRRAGVEPVIATGRWTQAGELAFYCEGQPRVFYLGLLLGDRQSQYDIWRPNLLDDPDVFKQGTFVLVGVGAESARELFEHAGSTRWIRYCEDGQLVAEWPITIAFGLRSRTRLSPDG